MIPINLGKIYRYLSNKTNNISTRGIESTIRYSFYNINTKKLFANYENIFEVEFDLDYFTIKNLISDFMDILENIEY